MNKYIGLFVFATACAQAATPAELGSVNWGVSERQGDRHTMEDDYAAVLNFKGNPKEAFFGIYDGHGGSLAARAAASGLQNQIAPLHELVAKSSLSGSILYETAYLQMDENIRKHLKDGTTAVTAHIVSGPNNPLAYLAWAGDARAVLVRQNGTVSIHTTDHKPDHENERIRIENAGERVELWGVPRIGGLAVSRSLGDDEIKKHAKSVIATPEVIQLNLLPRHHFLILACDGVWDVLSNEQAARIVKDALEHKGPLPIDPVTREITTEAGNSNRAQYAARALRDAAKNAGSTDNISVLVIEFDWQQKEEQLRDMCEADWERQRQLDADFAFALQLQEQK